VRNKNFRLDLVSFGPQIRTEHSAVRSICAVLECALRTV